MDFLLLWEVSRSCEKFFKRSGKQRLGHIVCGVAVDRKAGLQEVKVQGLKIGALQRQK